MMPWRLWVVLITRSTGSALRAVCPLYGVFFVKEFAWAAKLSFDGFLV
jgi:hypothetical protein